MNEPSAKKLKDVMTRQNLNWRSFTHQEEVSNRWNSPGTPSYYVIDHTGVIRHKWVGNPGPKAIDTALAKLIKGANTVRQPKPN